jgi:carbamate kinase
MTQPQLETTDPSRAGRPPLAVVALGGNALLARGARLEAASQAQAARGAARLLAPATASRRLVVTHGNGPQVGLLALMGDAYKDVAPYPLDVLDAETEGQIGYVLELELDNAVDHQPTAALITRVLVDAHDPAFGAPTKFIGPVYDEDEARGLAAARGWTVNPDGARWRRVVASPEPREIIHLPAIRKLLDAGFLLVCAGGGGIPVVDDGNGGQRGVEAVIDKDLCSALLADRLGAAVLALVTDVEGVFTDFGSPAQRRLSTATPEGLRSLEFPAGSMAPKVEAACRFVEGGPGRRAAIGSLDDIGRVLDGLAGTQVVARGAPLDYYDDPERDLT